MAEFLLKVLDLAGHGRARPKPPIKLVQIAEPTFDVSISSLELSCSMHAVFQKLFVQTRAIHDDRYALTQHPLGECFDHFVRSGPGFGCRDATHQNGTLDNIVI